MAISIGDAVLMIGADTSKLDKSLKSIGQKMSQVGKNLTLKLTAPLVAFGGLALKTAADYSKAMAKVNAVTGATTEQFAELNNIAQELGRTTQFTASQVADAMSFMGMAGMDTNQILAAIPDTLNLAAAGALDMADAANIVTNILAGFGMETDQLGKAVDVLALTFTSSNTDLLMLGEAMKFVGPVAKGFGLSFEETAAIVGTFGNAGIQASLAGTSLRGAIVQLNNKAEEFGITMFDATGKMIPMADILEQLEDKGFTAGQMMDLFGLRAGPAMTALLEKGSVALRDYTEELRNAGGTAQQIAEVQMEGLHGSITRMKSAFEGLQLQIADEIAPVFEGLMEKLRELIKWFSGLSDGQKGVIIKVLGVLALLGPALMLITNPIGLVVLAVGALIVAGIALWHNWEKVKTILELVWINIKIAFLSGVEKILGALAKFTKFIPFLGKKVKEAHDAIANMIAAEEVKKKTLEVIQVVRNMGDTFADAAIDSEKYGTALRTLKDDIDELGEAAEEVTDAVDEKTEAIEEEKTADEEAADSIDKLIGRLRHQRSEAGRLSISVRDVVDALMLEKKWNDETRDSLIALGGANADVNEFLSILGITALQVSEILGAHKDAVDDLTDSYDAAKQAASGLAAQQAAAAEAEAFAARAGAVDPSGIGGLQDAWNRARDLQREGKWKEAQELIDKEVIPRGQEVWGFKHGGIAMRPMTARIAERGPEAVIPLDRMGVFKTANIIITLDGRQIARAIGQPLVDVIKIRTGIRG